MGQLQKIEDELVELGYRILAISPDRPEKLREWRGKNPAGRFEPLSDSEMAAARAFGIAYRVEDKTREQLRGFGIDLAESAGQDHGLLPVPAVFLVGKDGRIKFQHVDPDYRVRPSPELVLAAARGAS